MSLAKPVIYDNFAQRQLQAGDISAAAELLTALTTAGAGTLTGAILASTIINRTGPGGGYTDTTDTATNIIAALSPVGGIQPGTSYRVRYINTVAFAMTLAAGTGVTLAGTTTVAASSVKDYLVTLTNTTPQSIAACSTSTVTPRVITGMTLAQTSAVSIGMLVTGTGIGASAKVVGIQPGTGVTVDVDSTATATLVAVTFAPAVTIQGLGQGTL